MIKKVNKVALSVLLISLIGNVSPIIVKANSNISQPNSFEDMSSIIQNKLRGMARGKSNTLVYDGKIEIKETIGYRGSEDSIPWDVSEVPIITPNNDMKISDGDILAANSTTFDNDTETSMNYNTPSFTYKNVNSSTSNTSESLNLGLTTTAEMKFPIASGSISSSVAFTFEKGASKTKTEEYSWTVPTQNIPVKPHQKIRVDWLLKTGKVEGTVNLQDRIGATIPYKLLSNGGRAGESISETVSNKNEFDTKNWDRFVGDDRLNWITAPVPNQDKVDYMVGKAHYTVNYGSEMIMKVIDITNGESKATTIKTVPLESRVIPKNK